MNNKILFSETQKITQWWIWLIMLIITISVIITAYQTLINARPENFVGLIIGLTICILLYTLLFTIRLKTIIKDDGIYVKLFPFHLSFRHYPWDIISESYIREYNSILEYGGWGLRGVYKDKAFNISGNKGLQLKFKNGKKLLIGTNKASEIKNIIENLHKV